MSAWSSSSLEVVARGHFIAEGVRLTARYPTRAVQVCSKSEEEENVEFSVSCHCMWVYLGNLGRNGAVLPVSSFTCFQLE